MNEEETVGYGKPPREHRFKPGNQAARGRRKAVKQALSISEILDQALNRRRKIKRGDQIVSMTAGEILVERFVQMMTSGSPREVVMMLGLIERHAPRALEQHGTKMEVVYHQAAGSNVALPPANPPGDK